MTNRQQIPPKWASKILLRINNLEDGYSLMDDLEIEFEDLASRKGRFSAVSWYILQVLKVIPQILFSTICRRLTMYKNYLKIALRNLRRQKAYSLINISGLTTGMVCCILISLWILDELNYDTYHDDAEFLYQAIKTFQGRPVTATPVLLAPALMEEFPEVVGASRFHSAGRILLTRGNDPFYEGSTFFVDPVFLKMFKFDFIYGDGNNALNDPRSIVLTRSIAEKYFGDEDPIGKVLTFNGEYNLAVKAVIEDVPFNSMVRFRILLPYTLRLELNVLEGYVPGWTHNSPLCYVRLRKGASGEDMQAKLTNYLGSKIRIVLPKETEKMTDDQLPQVSIKPLQWIRFDTVYRGESRRQTLTLFVAIAFVTLLIASINFMNLSTARSSRRAKEIGLRKVSGADRKNVIIQFLGESMVLSTIALITAVALAVLLLPAFNGMFGRNISFSILQNSYVPLLLLGITLFTGLAGGSYPAFFLSRFQPVNTLKGNLSAGTKNSVIRKILVAFQFVLSISLIIGTGIINDQLDYIREKDMGYEPDNVIMIPLNSGNRQYFETLKTRFETVPGVESVTGLQDRPSFIGSSTTYADWEGKNPEYNPTMGDFRINHDFIETMKIQLIQGRDFSREFATDLGNRFIINEEMRRIMRMDDVVGKRLMFAGQEGTVIGVVRDFHYTPLRMAMRPLVMRLIPERTGVMLVRVSPQSVPEILENLESSWKAVAPSFPFEFRFLESDFDRLYTGEQRAGDIFRTFSFIAIIIACMGIFGLAAYTAEQRTKECGVRKVLGASNGSIMNLLTKEFIALVLLSNILAYPLAYYVMNRWLEMFAYRTNIGVFVLLGASLIALAVTAFTVGLQAFRTARTNPVDSLRYE